jgi:hypothetical protein
VSESPTATSASHIGTEQWQSFEMRMRRRRAERCLLRASVALEAEFLDDAWEALDEAARLSPDDPEVAELLARLAEASTASPSAPAIDGEPSDPVAPVDREELEIFSSIDFQAARDLSLQDSVAAHADVVAVTDVPPRTKSGGRAGLAVAAALLLTVAGASWYGVERSGVLKRFGAGAGDVRSPVVTLTGSPTAPVREEPRAQETASSSPTDAPPAIVSTPREELGDAGDRPAANAGDAGLVAAPLAPVTTERERDGARATESEREDASATTGIKLDDAPGRRVSESVADPPAQPRRLADTLLPEREQRGAAPVADLPAAATGPVAAASPTPLTLPAAPPLAPPDSIPAPTSYLPPPAPVAAAETPVTPDPTASAPAGAPAAGAQPVDRERLVRAALTQYENAYTTLNAAAASAVWPSVDRRALARAFDDLASQTVTLGRCDVQMGSGSARVECAGNASWTPKVGGGTQTAQRRWHFELRESGGAWVIVRARVQ